MPCEKNKTKTKNGDSYRLPLSLNHPLPYSQYAEIEFRGLQEVNAKQNSYMDTVKV